MINFYSTHCPKCEVLKKKLDAAGLEYNLIDDKAEVIAKGREVKIMSAPFLVVDDKAYNFSDAVNYIAEVSK